MRNSSCFLAALAVLPVAFTSIADAKCLFCEGGMLSVDKPFSKGGTLSVDKPFSESGTLSVDKPFSKGGTLSVDKPFSEGGTLSINKPFNSSKIGSWGNDVADFVGKHPWETVAAVALIGGGAYLVMYEGYSLQVAVGTKTITLVSGGAVAGGSSIATGTGTIAYTMLKPDPSNSDASSKNKLKTDNGDVHSVLELPSPLPQIAENAGDIEKFNYALKVLQWSNRYEPPNSFDPEKYHGSFSPAETTLLKAVTVVQSVPDSPSELKATEQLEGRLEKIVDTVKDVATTGEPQWSALLKAAAPTTISDGTAASKAVLTDRLENQLQKYEFKRNPPLSTPSVKDIKPAPTGPTISAKP
jgi:hypothetical protein